MVFIKSSALLLAIAAILAATTADPSVNQKRGFLHKPKDKKCWDFKTEKECDQYLECNFSMCKLHDCSFGYALIVSDFWIYIGSYDCRDFK